MAKNIIFYFTGTGNSLHVAKVIADKLRDCELQQVATYDKKVVPEGYDRIGFVYPLYSGMPPRYMMDFIKSADFSLNPDSYYFQVMTSGSGIDGNAIYWINRWLKEKGLSLSAAYNIKSKPNYIVSYPISKDAEAASAKAKEKAEVIAKSIFDKQSTKIQNKTVGVLAFMNSRIAPKFAEMDREYVVSDACIGCGL